MRDKNYGGRIMEITFPGGKQVEALYKGFIIKTDQSKANGGEAAFPAPFDLFLASIGTCVGIYVLNFCQRREISSAGLKLFLEIEKNEDNGMVAKMSIKICLPDGFPDKYRDAVIKSAELCSVKRHMHNPPVFEITAE